MSILCQPSVTTSPREHGITTSSRNKEDINGLLALRRKRSQSPWRTCGGNSWRITSYVVRILRGVGVTTPSDSSGGCIGQRGCLLSPLLPMGAVDWTLHYSENRNVRKSSQWSTCDSRQRVGSKRWALPVPDIVSDGQLYSVCQYYSGCSITCNHAKNNQIEPPKQKPTMLVSKSDTLARLYSRRYSWNWCLGGAWGQPYRHKTQSPMWHLVHPIPWLKDWKLLPRRVQAQVPHIESTATLSTGGKLRKF